MILIIGFTLSFALAACGDGNPIGPSNQPEVANNPDNFQFQASNLVRTTQTLTYTWTNTAGRQRGPVGPDRQRRGYAQPS